MDENIGFENQAVDFLAEPAAGESTRVTPAVTESNQESEANPSQKNCEKASLEDLDEMVAVSVKIPLHLKMAMEMRNKFKGGSNSDCITAALESYLQVWVRRAVEIYADENNIPLDD